MASVVKRPSLAVAASTVPSTAAVAASVPVVEPDAFIIRVMRLVPPAIATSNGPLDLLTTSALSQTSDLADAVLSSTLAASSTFGNVCVGEHFQSYVTVANATPLTLRNAILKIELQTAANRIVLEASCADSTDPTVYANAKPRDFLVRHHMVESGVHCLVVSVSARDEQNMTRSVQKFFKFNVAPAIAVKIGTYAVEELVFAEAKISNLTTKPISLQSIRFAPFDGFEVDDIQNMTTPASPNVLPHVQTDSSVSSVGVMESESVLSSVLSATKAGLQNVLKPNETRALLYRIRMSDAACSINQASYTLGQLEVSWRSGLTQTASIQSELITRPRNVSGVGVVTQGQVEVVLTHCPSHAIVEQPFTVRLQIRNLMTQRAALRLQWRKEKMGPLLPYGPSALSLGVLEPKGQIEVALQLLPLAPGVHKVSGLRLVCGEPKVQCDFDQLHEVLVCKQSDEGAEPIKFNAP